jgi:hypothetical protein
MNNGDKDSCECGKASPDCDHAPDCVHSEVTTMTTEQHAVISKLRNSGYAVIIWTPEELLDVDPGQVEDRSIELGHQIIEDLKDFSSVGEVEL